MDATPIQVRKRGLLTLPAELRHRHNIREGGIFRLIDLDGLFVPTPMVSLVLEVAQEIERLRLEIGLTNDELLQDLREQRERYHAEAYGPEEWASGLRRPRRSVCRLGVPQRPRLQPRRPPDGRDHADRRCHLSSGDHRGGTTSGCDDACCGDAVPAPGRAVASRGPQS